MCKRQPRALLLWDIDGTILIGDRAGERALVIALRRVFGVDGELGRVDLAGRTDRIIAEDLLRIHGVEPTAERIHNLLEVYLGALAEEMPKGRPRLLPGVVHALEAVAARPDLAQGLLTGNLARGAELKLSQFDVWRFFPFGAFGDDSPYRNELGPHALRRAREHHGSGIAPERTFVIGDTPHDVACGKAIGAATIAVATGRFSVAELETCGPTIVLPNLEDTDGLLAFIDRQLAG